jgi:hypothetical protein
MDGVRTVDPRLKINSEDETDMNRRNFLKTGAAILTGVRGKRPISPWRFAS